MPRRERLLAHAKLRAPRSTVGERLQASELKQNHGHKKRVVVRIPSPQPAWLLCQPEQPLQAHALHPSRCSAELTRKEIERRPDAHHDGSDTCHVLVRPLLLERAPKADEDHACPRRIDGVNVRCVLFRCGRAKP